MSTAWLITGSNRGIGFGIVSHLATLPDNIIFASCRDLSKASDLEALASSPNTKAKIHILQLDASDTQSISVAAEKVTSLIGQSRLDYLINNAASSSGKETALTFSPTAFQDDMKNNVLGPALIAQAFLPFLERSGSNSRLPVVLNTSSGLGSIGLAHGPKEAVYSISKAALNMLTYKQSAEKPNIIWICLDPGWVRTDMGGPNAHLSVEESVQGVITVVTSVTPQDSGSFKHYSGTDIPW